VTEEIYQGYTIKGFEDGTYDIEDSDCELQDGGYKSVDECKAVIEGYAA
jgi:hypothetical protein